MRSFCVGLALEQKADPLIIREDELFFLGYVIFFLANAFDTARGTAGDGVDRSKKMIDTEHELYLNFCGMNPY